MFSTRALAIIGFVVFLILAVIFPSAIGIINSAFSVNGFFQQFFVPSFAVQAVVEEDSHDRTNYDAIRSTLTNRLRRSVENSSSTGGDLGRIVSRNAKTTQVTLAAKKSTINVHIKNQGSKADKVLITLKSSHPIDTSSISLDDTEYCGIKYTGRTKLVLGCDRLSKGDAVDLSLGLETDNVRGRTFSLRVNDENNPFGSLTLIETKPDIGEVTIAGDNMDTETHMLSWKGVNDLDHGPNLLLPNLIIIGFLVLAGIVVFLIFRGLFFALFFNEVWRRKRR